MGINESFKIDLNKAKEIAESIHQQYEKGTGFFQNSKIPEYEPPLGMIAGSKEHALYLTYIFALDHDVGSVETWKQARQLYQESPWFFDAAQILTRSDEGLSKMLVRIAVSNIDSSIKKWRVLSRILLEKYSGDPRNISSRTSDIAGVRKKTTEILQTNEDRRIHRYLQLMNLNGMLKIKDRDDVGVFVDTGTALFTICTGALKFEGEMFEGFLDKDPILLLTGKAWNETIRKIGVKPWELDESIHTMNKRLCPEMKCVVCPIFEECEKNFKLEIHGEKIRLRSEKTYVFRPVKFCIYCGRDITKVSTFCDNCGKEILKQEIMPCY